MALDTSPGHLRRPFATQFERALPVLILAALLAVVPFLGPDSIRLGPSFSWPAFTLQAVGAASIAAVWIAPQLGAPILVMFVYLNVSQILVSQHDLPSSLRVLIVLLVISAWRRRGGRAILEASINPLTLLLGLYVLLLMVSSTIARDASLADERWLEAMKAGVILILFVAMVSSREAVRLATWALVGVATLLSSLGIFQQLTGNFDNQFWGFARIKQAHIVDEVVQPRIAGPLGDPNFFAQILLIVVPIALALAWNERSGRLRTLALSSAGVIVTAIVLTYSRGAGLAMACQALLLWATSRRRLRLAAVTAIIAVVFITALPANFTRRLTTVRQLMPGEQTALHPDSSFEARKLFTQTAWQMFLDQPLLGVGAGNYTEYFDEYAERVGSAVRFSSIRKAHYPHNLYLEIAAESGLIGLSLFMAIVLTSFYFLERSRWRFLATNDTYLASLARALEISLVGYLVSSLFLHGHFIRYLWLLFAFATALDLIAKQVFSNRAETLGPPETVSSRPLKELSKVGTDDHGTSP